MVGGREAFGRQAKLAQVRVDAGEDGGGGVPTARRLDLGNARQDDGEAQHGHRAANQFVRQLVAQIGEQDGAVTNLLCVGLFDEDDDAVEKIIPIGDVGPLVQGGRQHLPKKREV